MVTAVRQTPPPQPTPTPTPEPPADSRIPSPAYGEQSRPSTTKATYTGPSQTPTYKPPAPSRGRRSPGAWVRPRVSALGAPPCCAPTGVPCCLASGLLGSLTPRPMRLCVLGSFVRQQHKVCSQGCHLVWLAQAHHRGGRHRHDCQFRREIQSADSAVIGGDGGDAPPQSVHAPDADTVIDVAAGEPLGAAVGITGPADEHRFRCFGNGYTSPATGTAGSARSNLRPATHPGSSSSPPSARCR